MPPQLARRRGRSRQSPANCWPIALQAVILPVYLLVLPYLYGLPRLGSAIPILIFAIPFVLAVAGLGFVVAGVFRHPLRVQLILAAAGLPLFMAAGFFRSEEHTSELQSHL